MMLDPVTSQGIKRSRSVPAGRVITMTPYRLMDWKTSHSLSRDKAMGKHARYLPSRNNPARFRPLSNYSDPSSIF
ncbi:MAG: hypothetical protein GYA24_12700 [Candidatus Lokiarchaeota archaeon]|nr:hypothetical protein [Candidatus Lokiarchaeota archaeon]